MTARQTPAQALARYVPVGAPDDCWLWTGPRNREGYGVAGCLGRTLRANRIAYEAAHGPIPPGHFVRHSCDNPPCVNPAHLLVGTPADNMNDKVERGRQALGRRIRNARLGEQDVLAIRARRAAGETYPSIAKDFDISESHAGRVAAGHWWKHVAVDPSSKEIAS